MSFSYSAPKFTQSATDTNLSNATLTANADNNIVLETSPAHRTVHLNGKWIEVTGTLTIDGDTDQLLIEGWTNTTAGQNAIYVNGGTLNFGSSTITDGKERLTGGQHLVLLSNDVTSQDEFGGGNSEYAGITKDTTGAINFYGGSVLSDETIAFDRNNDRSTTDTGRIYINGTKFIKLGSEVRELRFSKLTSGLYASGSAIIGMIVDGGFGVTHRALPSTAEFTLINGSINQLSRGPNSVTLSKLDVSKNTNTYDLGYDASNTDDLGSDSAKTYIVDGLAKNSNLRVLVKSNVEATATRRPGITLVQYSLKVSPVDINGASIASVARFIRDTNNGERLNQNGRDDTADKTHYWTDTSTQNVVTRINNRDSTSNLIALDGANKFDIRGKNYAVNIQVANQSALTADIISSNEKVTEILEGDYFQLSDMANAGNNGFWKANEDYGASTAGQVSASKTSTNPVNVASESATIALLKDDRFDIIIKRREYLSVTLQDVQFNGLVTNAEPEILTPLLVADSLWNNTNSGNPLGLTTFTDFLQVYDALKQWNELEANIETDLPASRAGAQLQAGSNNVVIDSGASSLIDYTGTTLTIDVNATITGGVETTGMTTIQGASNITSGTFTGDVTWSTTATTINNVTINGTLFFTIPDTYTINDSNITNVSSSVAGVIININSNTVISNNLTPSNITINPPQSTLTIQCPSGGILEIYDDDDSPNDYQDRGTLLQTTNPTTGADVTYNHTKGGDNVIISFIKEGFEEIDILYLLENNNQTLNLNQQLVIEENI